MSHVASVGMEDPARKDGANRGTYGDQSQLPSGHRWFNIWVWAQAFIGGLAGSSCCAVQLIINWLSSLNLITGIGCAGFNKTLGPIRGYVRIFSAVMLLLTFVVAVKGGKPQGALTRASITLAALTFLPEILVMSGGPAIAPPTHATEVVGLRVDGMGCEACQTNVQRMLGRFPGVVGAEVDFRLGNAKLLVARGWGEGRGGFNVTDVIERMFDKGYMVYPLAEKPKETEGDQGAGESEGKSEL